MDYFQNYSNINDTVPDEDTLTLERIIPSYQQQLPLTYPYNNEFQSRATNRNEIQLSNNDISNNGMQQVPEQSWNTHSILDSMTNETISCNNNEDLTQPERGIAGFVSKLYHCLQAPDDGHKYARWCRHNGIDMFIIDCIPKFTETVLPKLFKHCKFASFVRQLNIYGFQRDTDARKSKDSKDKETCRWHHIHFRPGRRDLFHLIRRKTPRYSRSRRKRPINEDDEEDDEEGDKRMDDDNTETILNIGSGDDDENENSIVFLDEGAQSITFEKRRRSTSEESSTITNLQHHNTMNTNQSETGQFDMLYENSQHGFDPYMQLATNGSSPTASSPAYSQLPVNNYSVVMPTALGNNIPHENMLLSQTTQGRQQQSDEEEQLRSEIDQLRKGYARMYKTLCGQVNKAVNLIEIQRNRIEYLEKAIHESQNYHQKTNFRQQAPYVDTTASNNIIHNYTSNSNNDVITNNGVLFQQSTNAPPVTPIYHQTSTRHHLLQKQHNQQMQIPDNSHRTMNDDGFGFLFSNNNSTSINSVLEDERNIPSRIQQLQAKRRSPGVASISDS